MKLKDLPDTEVKVKVSCCNACTFVVRASIEHQMNEETKKEFYKEVSDYELDVKTIPLLEYRKGVFFCTCSNKKEMDKKNIDENNEIVKNNELTEEQINMLKYFWKETWDIEKYGHYEKIKPKIQEQIPELLTAWEQYKLSIKTMDIIVNSLQ